MNDRRFGGYISHFYKKCASVHANIFESCILPRQLRYVQNMRIIVFYLDLPLLLKLMVYEPLCEFSVYPPTLITL